MNEAKQEDLLAITQMCEKILEGGQVATLGPWISTSPMATHLISEASQNPGKLVCDFPVSSGKLEQGNVDSRFTSDMREFCEPAARMILFLVGILKENDWPVGSNESVPVKAIVTLSEAVQRWKGEG